MSSGVKNLAYSPSEVLHWNSDSEYYQNEILNHTSLIWKHEIIKSLIYLISLNLNNTKTKFQILILKHTFNIQTWQNNNDNWNKVNFLCKLWIQMFETAVCLVSWCVCTCVHTWLLKKCKSWKVKGKCKK